MYKYYFSLIFLASFSSSRAQFRSPRVEDVRSGDPVHNAARQISVEGAAEREVTPDIIYVSMNLREYLIDGSSKQKLPIEELEQNFLRKVYDAGVKPASITIEGFSGSINSPNKKKNEQFFASKHYIIKMSDLDRMNSLVSTLDQKALSGVYISRFEYSKQEDVKKELRILALQDARSRASSMLTALQENLGEPLFIEESSTSGPSATPFFSSMRDKSAREPEIDFKKVKLSCLVKVVFRIK